MRGQKRRRHPASRGQGIQRSCPQYESFQFAFLGKSLWIFTAILILPMTTLPERLIPWKPTHFFSRTSIRGNGGEGGRMATPHCLSLTSDFTAATLSPFPTHSGCLKSRGLSLFLIRGGLPRVYLSLHCGAQDGEHLDRSKCRGG